MWNKEKKAPVAQYLLWVAVIWIFAFAVLRTLTDYSVLYMESGTVTWQYIVYAVVGMLFTTPAPMLALFIMHLWILSARSMIGIYCLIPSPETLQGICTD